MPGSGVTLSTALLGEAVTTFMMVALLAVFLSLRKIRPFTPAIFFDSDRDRLFRRMAMRSARSGRNSGGRNPGDTITT